MKRCVLFVLLGWVALSPSAAGTWSIILVDTATGEVAIGSATCLESFNLVQGLPVVVVGKGAAAAQSQIDVGAVNRKKIWDGLHAGKPVNEILKDAKEGDIFKCSRQYGIADLSPRAVAFTGNCANPYKQHTRDTFRSITYCIQGNILTGAPVIAAAEAAVVNTEGRLSDRLMAAMQAARAMGGDGRCSCLTGGAQSCGSPPSEGFEKSAHVGFMIVARMGDTDGVCNGGIGCANGIYWLKLNVTGGAAAPDPVETLQAQYDAHIEGLRGHPDGLTSCADWDDAEVLGDGLSVRELHIALFDVDGAPIASGGAAIEVTHAADSAGLGTVLEVLDHGNGGYSVRVRAGSGHGLDRFRVTVDDGDVKATLYPYPALDHRPALRVDAAAVSSAQGGAVGFDLLGPAEAAGKVVVMAFSMSGTEPGFEFGDGHHVPLNKDRWFFASDALMAAGIVRGMPRFLNAAARGRATLMAPPGLLDPLIGGELSMIWATWPVDYLSNAVTLTVDP